MQHKTVNFGILSEIVTHPCYTLCPQKKYQVCFLSISPSNLNQIQKGRSVSKSACPEDLKTVLDFQFWPSRSWDIGVRIHQGSFSVFTFFCKKLNRFRFSRFDHSSGLSKPQFDISHYFFVIFSTQTEKWLKMTGKC